MNYNYYILEFDYFEYQKERKMNKNNEKDQIKVEKKKKRSPNYLIPPPPQKKKGGVVSLYFVFCHICTSSALILVIDETDLVGVAQ